ncbi:MAG: MFS transporter [Anaerolineaceae bacterium]|jgi:MFS family permease
MQISAGGAWSNELDTTTQRNLRWFFFDGLFFSISDAIVLTYLTLYLLALGATSAQIGLMAAFSSLSATLLLIPGAMLAERMGQRKLIVVMAGGGVSRIALLLMALTPFLFDASFAVYFAIGLRMLADGMSNLGIPAWTSLSADIVPLQRRGAYFGTRNIAMAIANMTTILLVGLMLTRMDSLAGYQLALAIAFLIGLGATYSYWRIQEPARPAAMQPRQSYHPRELFKVFRVNKTFLAVCLHALLWNGSLAIAGPFFNVHLVQNMNASAAMVGVITMVSSFTSLPGLRLFGLLCDRIGPRRVQLMTGLVIPFLPMAWVFITAPWQAMVVNFFGGFLWAGFGLAAFNYLLLLIPADQRERYTAIYQIVVTVASAAGAAMGGLVATQWGFTANFALSGVGRVAAMLIFVFFVRQMKSGSSIEAPGDATLVQR